MDPSTTSSDFSVSDTLTAKLLAAADKYGLERLRLMCESCLCKDICVSSVANILTLADHCHARELKAVCLKFAAQNLAAVMRSDGFECMKEKCPYLQSEILKTIAGCEGDSCSAGEKSQSVWAQLSDGGDTNGVVHAEKVGDKNDKGKGEGKPSSVQLFHVSMGSSLEKTGRLDAMQVLCVNVTNLVYVVSAEQSLKMSSSAVNF